MLDIVCVGSATIDNFLTVHQKLKSITYGAKVLVKHLETHTGGGGSNSAVALSKLGLKVGYLGKLGDDDNAEILEEEFRHYGVSVLNKKKSKLHTDLAFILNSEQEKDRIIYVHKGSSGDLVLRDIPKLDTKWFYLATLVGKSFPVLIRLSKYAKRKGVKVLFNPSTYLARKGLRKLKPILKNADVVVLNREEAKLLLKARKGDVKYLLKSLKKHVKDIVVITNGPKKLYALHRNVVYSLQPPKIKVIHTAGAGDAFNSGFLFGIIKKYPFEEALKLGQANASSVIQHFGTKNKLLTGKEAKRLIGRLKIKVIKHAF